MIKQESDQIIAQIISETSTSSSSRYTIIHELSTILYVAQRHSCVAHTINVNASECPNC